MAAAVAGSVLAPVSNAAHEQFDALKNDPIEWTLNLLVKGGTVLAIVGGIMMLSAPVLARQEQAFLNDIQDRLGLARQTSPTPPRKPPPPPPPPPAYIGDYVNIVRQLANLSSINAVTAANQLYSAWQSANDLHDQFVADSSPKQFVDDSASLRDVLWLSFQNFHYVTQAQYQQALALLQKDQTQAVALEKQISQATDATTIETLQKQLAVVVEDLARQAKVVQTYESQAGPIYPDWVFAKTEVLLCLAGANAIAKDLGEPKPFDEVNSGGDQGSAFWGIVYLFTIPAQVLAAVPEAIGSAIVTIGQDLYQIGSDIGTGLAVMGKFLMNAPFILWDALGYAFTWTAHTIFEDLGPLLLGLGLAMAAVGSFGKLFYHNFWPRLHRRILLNANARTANLWNRFDRWNRSRKKVGLIRAEAATEISIDKANALTETEVVPVVETPAVIEAGRPAEAQRTKPEEGAGAVPRTEFVSPPEPPSPPPPEEKPIPGGATTEETEKFLGEHPTRAPTVEELRKQEANRIETLPPPLPVAPMTYRQHKEEREREKAEKLLAMGANWGE